MGSESTGTQSAQLQKRIARLEGQVHAIGAIGAAMAWSLGFEGLFERMVPHISRMMNAERTTLFLVDEEQGQIWSKVAEGDDITEIRLAIGQGIAGWVAANKQDATIADAYDDPRFNRRVDDESGFRTRSVAAVPLLGTRGELLGVIQVLNRRDGTFGQDDLELLRAIANQAAYAVENAALGQQILDSNRSLATARSEAEGRSAVLDLLYQIEREISGSFDLDELIESVIARACERLRSEAGSVLLAEEESGRLVFRGVVSSAKDELRKMTLESSRGIVGWVMSRGEPVIVNDPTDDPRHDHDVAVCADLPARALMAVPLIWNETVVGAMEMRNPAGADDDASRSYTDADLRVLSIIAGQLAGAIAVARERHRRLDAERMAAVGKMLMGVTHDLRNPMTVISGFAQIMAAEQNGRERQAACERITDQIDEMTTMISDLLAFARGDTRLRPSIVEVGSLGAEVQSVLATRCVPRGIDLVVEASQGIATVDLGRTKRILYNLARNAVDVLSRGGHLRVGLASRDNGLALEVADNGPGIPDEVRDRMFQPFVSAGKEDGTGLGLSIVKRFVDDHRGEITVRSGVKEGTVFEVYLPAAETHRSGGQ